MTAVGRTIILTHPVMDEVEARTIASPWTFSFFIMTLLVVASIGRGESLSVSSGRSMVYGCVGRRAGGLVVSLAGKRAGRRAGRWPG